MLTVFVAALAPLCVGWMLGRAPLFRFLTFVLAPFVFLTMAVAWWAVVVALDADHLLRSLGPALYVVVALALVPWPPLLIAGWLIRRVRRRGGLRFMPRLAARPARLPQRRILMVQAGV